MAYDSSIIIEIIGSMAGRPTYNRLYYFRETASANVLSSAVANAWNSTCTALLLAATSEAWTLAEIRAAVYQLPSNLNKPQYTLVVDDTGDVAGDALGANIVVNTLLIPDNPQIDPVSAAPFEGGRLGWTGVPEGQQNRGFLNDVAMALWLDFSESLETLSVDVSGTPTEWVLGMYRQPNTIPSSTTFARVPVLETDVSQKLGTRNSRK